MEWRNAVKPLIAASAAIKMGIEENTGSSGHDADA